MKVFQHQSTLYLLMLYWLSSCGAFKNLFIGFSFQLNHPSYVYFGTSLKIVCREQDWRLVIQYYWFRDNEGLCLTIIHVIFPQSVKEMGAGILREKIPMSTRWNQENENEAYDVVRPDVPSWFNSSLPLTGVVPLVFRLWLISAASLSAGQYHSLPNLGSGIHMILWWVSLVWCSKPAENVTCIIDLLSIWSWLSLGRRGGSWQVQKGLNLSVKLVQSTFSNHTIICEERFEHIGNIITFPLPSDVHVQAV